MTIAPPQCDYLITFWMLVNWLAFSSGCSIPQSGDSFVNALLFSSQNPHPLDKLDLDLRLCDSLNNVFCLTADSLNQSKNGCKIESRSHGNSIHNDLKPKFQAQLWL